MPGYLIAVLLCAGSTCDMAPLEPGVSYATDTQCAAALVAKDGALADAAVARRPGARQVQTLCIQAASSVTEVEAQYDVLETVVVHSAPSAESGYVGVLEGGQRALVTGLVGGTDWVRVLLPEGGIGFVFADNLRRVGAPVAAPAAAPGPASAAPLPAALLPAAAAPPAVPPPGATVSAAAPAGPVQPAPPVPAAQATGPGTAPGQGRPAASVAAEMQDCPTCPVLVRLPAGSFAMGSSRDASERPVRRVAVPAFALGKYPVTVAEWGACAAAGGCDYKPAAALAQAQLPTQPQAQQAAARRPMVNLSWNDAMQYVQWLSQATAKAYRLPSEAEWEYAARAGSGTRYSWGDRAGKGQVDCKGCGGPQDSRGPAEVTAFPANPWGLSGMGGGVAQWVEDCWHPTYQGAPAHGTAWRMEGCQQNVLRGGSWLSPPSDVTVSGRNPYDTSVRYLANGMRVALSLPDAGQ